jgi:hypothetical protein
MMESKTIKLLREERKQCDDKIDAAYWRFCRCARALPPVMAEPEAYRRRAEIDKILDSHKGVIT